MAESFLDCSLKLTSFKKGSDVFGTKEKWALSLSIFDHQPKTLFVTSCHGKVGSYAAVVYIHGKQHWQKSFTW